MFGNAITPILLFIYFYSLGDPDDDVRSVAASCLLPIAGHLVEQLPESLGQVLLVLWRCLRNMKDDLSSSVGAVMDLLGRSSHLLCDLSSIFFRKARII